MVNRDTPEKKSDAASLREETHTGKNVGEA